MNRSADGRKQEAWDDVTKCFLFHKTAVLINWLDHWGTSMLNMQLKYIKLIAFMLCQPSSG